MNTEVSYPKLDYSRYYSKLENVLWNQQSVFCTEYNSTESKLVLLLLVCQARSYLGGPRRWNQEEISKCYTGQNKRTSHSGLSCWWGRGWIFWWTVLATDLCYVKYLTYLWCWAYPKVPDLPELHCNCDMGMLMLTGQLLATKKKEKKHDYTYHLVTSLNFISSRNICSALPSIDWGKNGGRFLVKAQFKKKPKFWREAQGKENNTKSQILDFNSWHFFGTSNVCEFFPKLNIKLFVWIFISCLMLFKEYWQTYFPLV